MREFVQLLAASNEVVVVDLRPELQRRPLPFPPVQVLSIGPGELPELLEWLPQNRSAVFCGASGIALSLIRTSPCMRGSAPLYVLNDDSVRAEVA